MAEKIPEASKISPDQISLRLDRAKDSIWGSDGPDMETARSLLKAIPGSEEVLSHLDEMDRLPPDHFLNEGIMRHHATNLEHSMDRLAESHGVPAVPNAEGPMSFLSHARQRMPGWDQDIHSTYRTFLNALEDLSVKTGRHPDELMKEYFDSPDHYHSGPVGELVQKHDQEGNLLSDAFFQDAENYLE